jgi:hypothetical protein
MASHRVADRVRHFAAMLVTGAVGLLRRSRHRYNPEI